MPVRAIDQWTLFRRSGVLAFLGVIGGLVGCSNIEPVAPVEAPITDPRQLYMQLTLDYPAANLSTSNTIASYHTLQLTAIPRDALGNAMVGLPAPTYRSSDTTAVQVTPDGLVTAVGVTGAVEVIAELTAGPVTHADTSVIQVTNLTWPPQLASLSIDPVLPDSAIWTVQTTLSTGSDVGFYLLALGGYLGTLGGPDFRIPGTAQLVPRALDATDAEIAGLVLDYISLNPEIATIDRQTGLVAIVRPGQGKIVARTTAYGIDKVDTMTFTATQPVFQTVTIDVGPMGTLGFIPGEIRLRPYGIVYWGNTQSDPMDIRFDDPTKAMLPPPALCDALALPLVMLLTGTQSSCGAGDLLIPGHLDGDISNGQMRQFAEPGIYPYRIMRTGATGQVVVTAEFN